MLEYIEGGELFKYIQRLSRLEGDTPKFYAAQITLVFEYLHSKGVIYQLNIIFSLYTET